MILSACVAFRQGHRHSSVIHLAEASVTTVSRTKFESIYSNKMRKLAPHHEGLLYIIYYILYIIYYILYIIYYILYIIIYNI